MVPLLSNLPMETDLSSIIKTEKWKVYFNQGATGLTFDGFSFQKNTYHRSFHLGKAVHTSTNGKSTEECYYENGLRQGPSIDKRENGDVEERTYTNGILEGSAVLLGGNGDKLEFTYR